MDISSHIITPSGTPDLSDIYFIGNEGWITSSNLPEIYHTTDGEATFTKQTTKYPCNAIFMKSITEGYAGGQSGHVYHTTDGGTSWNFHGTIGITLLSISFPPGSDTGYCCGYTGKIGRITSSGVSQMTTGFVSNMASITFPTTLEGWVCGEDVIRHYVNGSWTADQTYDYGTYNGICFADTHNGWAVGDGGYIIHTIDGANWTEQQVGSTGLYHVFFLDVQNGWTVGSSGVIYHTSNRGLNWIQEATGLTTHFLRSVHAVNKRINCLKIFLKEMVEDGKTDNLLFKQFRTGITGVWKQSVITPTMDEFKILCNAKLEDKRISYVRDVYVLEASTGLRFSDVIKIKNENIHPEKGKYYIITNIQKILEAQHRIPLNEMAHSILVKYPQ